MELLILSLVTSLKITFIYVIFNWEGMLFTKAGNIIEYRVNKFIAKPLITCQICMTSLWGTIFWMMEGKSLLHVNEFLQFLFLVGGINVLIACLTGPKQLENQMHDA